MPEISCSAHTCAYNSNNCCTLNNVQVSGDNAKKTCETVCESFCERGTCASNSCDCHECGCDSVIDCSATKCMYNDSGHCSSNSVDINGMGASTADQTECATFVKK